MISFKQVLGLAAVFAVLFTGCGDDRALNDKMVKNYENAINKDFKDTLEANGTNVKANDFKCQKDTQNQSKIICMSENLKLADNNNKEILSVDRIEIRSTSFYFGKKSGKISLDEALGDIAKQKTSDEIEFVGVRINPYSFAMFQLLFGSAIENNFNLKLSINSQKKNDVLDTDFNASFFDKSENIKLSLSSKQDFDWKLLLLLSQKDIAKYDTNTQTMVPGENNTKDEMIEEISNYALELVSLQNISTLVQIKDDNIAKMIELRLEELISNANLKTNSEKEFLEASRKIITNFMQNAPHIFDGKVEFKKSPKTTLKALNSASLEDGLNYFEMIKLNNIELLDIFKKGVKEHLQKEAELKKNTEIVKNIANLDTLLKDLSAFYIVNDGLDFTDKKLSDITNIPAFMKINDEMCGEFSLNNNSLQFKTFKKEACDELWEKISQNSFARGLGLLKNAKNKPLNCNISVDLKGSGFVSCE